MILKSGDDPRQDQLILQLILLMDRLLRKENLDLKLIPFKVLACSSTFGKLIAHLTSCDPACSMSKSVTITTCHIGLHECIESTTVFHVLSKYRSIQVRTVSLLLIVGCNIYLYQSYLRQCCPVRDAPYGIKPDVMDTYVKSCG